MIQVTRPRCWIERVVDSDTLVVWIEATPDVRVRYRVRLVGIEGGELDTDEGRFGAASLTAHLERLQAQRLYWHGSLLTRDQHGRLVGDVVDDTGSRLTTDLLACGSHWRRDKSGNEKRN